MGAEKRGSDLYFRFRRRKFPRSPAESQRRRVSLSGFDAVFRKGNSADFQGHGGYVRFLREQSRREIRRRGLHASSGGGQSRAGNEQLYGDERRLRARGFEKREGHMARRARIRASMVGQYGHEPRLDAFLAQRRHRHFYDRRV